MSRGLFVSFVSSVSLRAPARSCGPDDRRAGAPATSASRACRPRRCRRRCARSASTRTSIEHAAARHAVPRRAGRDRPARRLLRHAAGRAGVRLLRLPDAVHAGHQRDWRARWTCCRSTPGKDFEIVTVSFDPRDTPATAAAKKAGYLERYKRPGADAGWHFLTGDQPSIERADAAPPASATSGTTDTKQFAHPTGIIVLTPDGRLARYLFGIEYGPRDLRLAHRRGLGRQGRLAGRLAAALLLSLRPDDRPLRPGHHARDAHRRRGDGPRARHVHRRHGAPRATNARTRHERSAP